jgi:Cu-processing system permease protein
MNIILVLVPLIATIFGVMYYYNSREFVELLLSQPIKRRDIFVGQYLGIASSLSLSVLIGVGLPFLLYGVIGSNQIWNYLTLLFIAVILSVIFSGIAYWIAIKCENRIKGFGYAIFAWLFFAIIYDAIFLLLLSGFSDYPLDKFALGFSMANPIDLSRILIMLKLDISALMGYTGAVFQKFLGNITGILVAIGLIIAWISAPTLGILFSSKRKDF